MRIIVTGGRDQDDKAYVWWVLDDVRAKWGPIDEVVVGVDPDFPKGTDKLAWEWAEDRGIERRAFTAAWRPHGKAAGPIRNGQMARYVDPDADKCIAFPGGDGTADMVKQARGRGIKVIEVAPKKRIRNEDGTWTDTGRWTGPLRLPGDE